MMKAVGEWFLRSPEVQEDRQVSEQDHGREEKPLLKEAELEKIHSLPNGKGIRAAVRSY
jgi:hypothetical protein